MKKFYLLLVALLAAVSVNAAVEKLYMIDNFGGEWNLSSGREMTMTESGVFKTGEVEVPSDGCYFKFTQKLGSWADVEADNNAYVFVPDTKDCPAEIGTYSVTSGNNNSWKINKGSYVFTVDTNKKTLTISDPSSVEPIEPERADKWRVWSNLAGGTEWSANDMTYKNGVWEVVVNVRQTGSSAHFGLQYFEDKNVDSKVWYAAQAGSSAVKLDTPMTIVSSNTADFVFGNLDAGDYLFSLNDEKKQLTITAVEGGEVTGMRYAVRTNIFSGTEETIDFEEVDGKWQYTGTVTTNGQILVVCRDDDGNETVYGSPAAGTTTNINVPLNLSQGNTPYEFNRHFTEGEFADLRNFRLIFDPAAKTLMLLRVGAPIYMLGSVDQSSWNTSNRKHPMNVLEGTNIYNSDFIQFKGNPVDDGFAYFLFTSTPSAEGATEDWTTANIGRYSPGVDDIDLTDRKFYQITKNTNEKSFKVPTGTCMRVVINLDTRFNEFYRGEDLAPETLYLHGDLWKHRFDWSGNDSAYGYEDNGIKVYCFENMLIEDHGDGYGYYAVSNWRRESDVSVAAVGVASRVAGESPDEALVSELAANGHVYNAEGSVRLKNTYSTVDKAFVKVPANTYHTITVHVRTENVKDAEGNVTQFAGDVVKFDDLDVTDTITTGVESVEVEDANAAVEYYNMQGVRVANPENGMYIRRKGNTVTKVFVK